MSDSDNQAAMGAYLERLDFAFARALDEYATAIDLMREDLRSTGIVSAERLDAFLRTAERLLEPQREVLELLRGTARELRGAF